MNVLALPAAQRWRAGRYGQSGRAGLGLAPYNPAALLRQDMQPYYRDLSQLMGQGGAVRIDHILGHSRAFWMPDENALGGYVSYPFEALTHMIARASSENECVIFW